MSGLGSKPEKLNMSKCFPLFTQQRTSPRYFGMSASCPKADLIKRRGCFFIDADEQPIPIA
jgi:hypothetical protein